MNAAINDLSFAKSFSSKEEAIDKVRQWMEVCRRIESGEMTEIRTLCSTLINTKEEIAPGYLLIQLVKEFHTQDEKRYLLHLLTNLGEPEEMPEDPFLLDEDSSFICAWAKEGILASIETKDVFTKPELNGLIGQNKVSIKNISKLEHIALYKKWLGIRCYEANKKHRREPYIDKAGRQVAAMDLNDLEAQKLLNQAVDIDGKLYGKRHGQYYSFQNHHDNCYHGYINNNLDENIIKKIDTQRWE